MPSRITIAEGKGPAPTVPRRLSERISVRRNPVTKTWRVYIGERLAYYCASWDEAMERANGMARAAVQ